MFGQGHDAGIEALQMADLENGPSSFSQIDDALALLPSCRDGFFQQHVDATPQKGFSHGQMGGRRYHDGNGIDLVGDAIQAIEGGATRFLGDLTRPLQIRVNDPYQLHIGQAGVNQGVKTPQITDANDGYTNFVSHV